MKHSQVLKRAWKILWNYKALWIFGAILAITSGGISGQTMWSGNDDDFQPQNSQEMVFSPDEPFWPQLFEQVREEWDEEWEEAKEEFGRLLSPENANKLERTLLRAAIIFTIVMVFLYIIFQILRYVSEAAIVKMVDSFEETGEKLTIREGWRLGWSRQAWRVFLIDLAIFLPAFIVFIAVLAVALAPIITASTGSPIRGVLGLVASIGLLILFGLFGLLFAAIVSLFKPVFYRKAILEDLSVGQSFREGFRMFFQCWKQYGLMWLILKGIDLVWPLVMLPFVLLTGVIGLMLGGGVTLLAGGRAIESGDPSMIWSIMIGIIILIIVVGIPMAFIGGLRETFQSSSWTLTYRELTALKSIENGELPLVETEE
jgi:hypothetical protein